MWRQNGNRSPTVALGAACIFLVLVSGALLAQNRSLSERLAAERAQRAAITQQVRVLSVRAQDARTPDLLLHRFLIAWILGSGAEANLYLGPGLQEAWRGSLAAAGWKPGPRGVSIDHYRVDEAQETVAGARYRMTMFAGPDESNPAYTMTVTIAGHPGAYAVTAIEVGGVPSSPGTSR